MTVAPPRQLVHGGRILAHALYIDAGLVGEPEARRRCLRAACGGARVDAVAEGYVVYFEAPRAVLTDRSEGLALTRCGGTLVAAPMTTEPDCARGGIALVRDGRVEVHAAPTPVDMADWIDVSAFAAVHTQALGDPPVPVSAKLSASSSPTGVRDILGAAIPEPDQRVPDLVAALKRAEEARADSAASHSGSRLTGWLSRLLGGEQRALKAPAGSPSPVSTSGAPVPPRPTLPPAEPGVIRRWLRRRLLASPMADLIGRKQAQYLRRTLDMFERGDIEQALRHAIPMGAGGGEVSVGPSLSVPTPRGDLGLGTLGSAGPSTTLGMSGELLNRFRDLYRRAADDLAAQGRVEEAAYVLFELLGDKDAGVALLEAHDRFDLAAQMAQRHEMAPGLVVRLWVLAKQPVRAALFARQTNAFGDAVARLQASHPELATYLRIQWADWLASGGDYAAAIDAVWPAEAARHLASAWLDRAIAFGGPLGTRMLVKKLDLHRADSSARDQVSAAVVAILEADGPGAAVDREALMEHLTQLKAPLPPLAFELTRALVRAVVVDRGACVGSVAAVTERAGALFDHDVNRLVANPNPVSPTPQRSSIIDAAERGLLHVHDAVVLHNGNVLAALGEAGLHLLGRDGRVLRRYQHPATRIIINAQTTRAITAVERGESWSLHRIDLTTGKAAPWCDANITAASEHYDGARWFTAESDAVSAIDAQADGFEALWRVGQLPGPVLGIATDPAWLTIVIGGTQRQVWRYALTPRGPVLRSRKDLPDASGEGEARVALQPGGAVALAELPHAAPWQLTVVAERTHHTALDRQASPVRLGTDGFGVMTPGDRGVELRPVRDGTQGNATLTLEGATTANLRYDPRFDTVVDDRGRIVLLRRDHTIERLLLVH